MLLYQNILEWVIFKQRNSFPTLYSWEFQGQGTALADSVEQAHFL